MAKLEGVRILDAVNGEVFKVEYDGEVYERVAYGKAQEGDIGLVTEAWGDQNVGEYFEIKRVFSSGIVTYYEMDGNTCEADCRAHRMTPFRKQSANPSPEITHVKIVKNNRPDKGRGSGYSKTYAGWSSGGQGLVKIGSVGELVEAVDGGVYAKFAESDALRPQHKFDRFYLENGEFEYLVKVSEPQIGGYVVFDANGIDITAGKHYEIEDVEDGEFQIIDDAGMCRTSLLTVKAFYAKVGEPTGIHTVTSEDIAKESQQHLFAKVNRPGGKPIEGDYVEFTDIDWMIDYVTAGKKYEVFMEDGVLSFLDDDGDDFDVIDEFDDWKVGTIYVKYSQEQAEQKAKVGDRILVVDEDGCSCNEHENGEICEVVIANKNDEDMVIVKGKGILIYGKEYIVLTPQQYGETQEEVVAEDVEVSPTFSVGDYVIAITKDKQIAPYRITVPEAGAMVVSRVIDSNFIKVTLLNSFKEGDKGVSFDVQPEFFRKATQDEIAKALGLDDVQVGDKIEVLAEDHFVLNKGEVFTVDEIDEDDNGDWSVNVRGWIALYAFLHGKPRFKVVNKAEESEEESQGFSEGDIVVITGNSNSSINGIGDIGIVGEVNPHTGSRIVNVEGRVGVGNFTKPSEMRHATTEEKMEFERNQSSESSETIEKGDLVQVVSSPCALPNGSYFVVSEVDEDGKLFGVQKDGLGEYVYAAKHVKLIAKASDVYV